MKNYYSNISDVKKDIQYHNLSYNLYQQELKNHNKITQKQKQKEEEFQMNRRAMTEAQEQKNKQINKKLYIQQLLAREYEKQINEKNINNREERRKNYSYAEIEQNYQNQYEKKRSRDLARIYKAQKSRVQSELNNEEELPYSSSIKMQQKQPKAITQAVIPHQQQNYKDYLQEEIAKRQKRREDERKAQRERQKQFQMRNKEELQKQKLGMMEAQKFRKLTFKQGLDEQIARKHSMNHYL